MKNIFIDMSDFTVWKGHFTGIQRVVFNIAVRYFNDEKYNTKFFYFDNSNKIFYQFDFNGFLDSLKITTLKGENIPIKRQLINKSKNIYLQSYFFKKMLPPRQAKKIATNALRIYFKAREANKLFNHKIINNNANRNKIEFHEEDTVLILGNTWDRPKLLEEIAKIKNNINIKVYQVVYDLIPSFAPQAFNEELYDIYTRNMFEVATTSDAVMCISKFTKKEFLRFCTVLNIKHPRTEVIRLGDDIPTSNKPIKPINVKIGEKFVLCVGTIEARKNHILLYYAWKEGIRQHVQMPKLILVGRVGWYTQDIIHYITSDPEVKDRIIILNDVSDAELVWLYSNCLFTIYPSSYEGWGLPVAESLAIGKACLSSNASSMPEIGGDLVEYFSPFNSGECLERIVSYFDESFLKEKERLIKEKYKKNLWKDTHKKVDSIINW